MTARKTVAGLCTATAIVAASAVPASAAPSGQEYLPKVPSATGHQPADDAQPSGGSVAPSTTTTETTSSTPVAKDKKTDKGNGAKKESTNANAVPVSSDDSGSSGGGSSALLPVVLLIAAGVIITAVGMTLRHRGGDDPETGDGGPGRNQPVKGDTPNARPTPDGEIVAGGENAP
jgi:hypothetical protein